jgi:hypothetical protein
MKRCPSYVLEHKSGMALDGAQPCLYPDIFPPPPDSAVVGHSSFPRFSEARVPRPGIFNLSKSDQYRLTFSMYADLVEKIKENDGYKRARH